MYKPTSLRTFLVAAIPDLARDPDRLLLYIDDGSLALTFAPGLSWEYQYTLNLIITDFTADPDVLLAPLLDWLRVNQPDQLQNPDQASQLVRFEADILSNDAVDLSLKLKLTERAVCKVQPDGSYAVTHPAEPQPETPYSATHWRLQAGNDPTGETIAAEWDTPSV